MGRAEQARLDGNGGPGGYPEAMCLMLAYEGRIGRTLMADVAMGDGVYLFLSP